MSAPQILGSNPTLRWDEYGFTLVNFEHLIPPMAQSFAFPMHVEQVFFALDIRSTRNWKVVLCQEPKGCRSKFTKKPNP
jgi:hypothetical protein